MIKTTRPRSSPPWWSVLLVGVCLNGGCADPPAPALHSSERAPVSAPSASASASAVNGSVTAIAATCGATGLPDCPLQRWMKATLQAYLKAGDTERLAGALDELALKEPKGFAGWEETASKAARAARAGDLVSVRAACKACHEQQRARFRSEIRTQRLF